MQGRGQGKGAMGLASSAMTAIALPPSACVAGYGARASGAMGLGFFRGSIGHPTHWSSPRMM